MLSGCTGGFLGSVLGTIDWNTNPELKDKKSAFIIAGTISATVIGGIISAFIKKDKTIYITSTPLTFASGVEISSAYRPALVLAIKVPINL